MNKLIKKEDWPKEQIELIKNTVAVGTTDDQLKLFLYTCKRTGLDPLTRQIYCVVRQVNRKVGNDWVKEPAMTIQTGIDGYRVVAERSGTLAGIDDAIYDNEDGVNPNKATVTVHKIVNNIRVPFTASARWNEYAQYFEDYTTKQKKLGNMWAKMPYLMLAKCAESLALRKAFPNDLTGVYTTEEMQQADNVIAHEKTAILQPEQLDETSSGVPTGGGDLAEWEMMTEAQGKKLGHQMQVLSLTKEAVAERATKLIGRKITGGNELTKAEAITLIQELEKEITT